MARRVHEPAVVLLVAAVQFVNILDFMMVMPLGPDFAAALGIPSSQLGLIGGSYTAAAAVSGLAGALFLDRFDRRKALGVALAGLAAGTAAGGFATGLGSLMAARILAGAFGGPATSLSFSIIADVVPPERRGRAMGLVMGAFSVASVLGVPSGLWLAAHGGWRVPFFGVAALGVVTLVLAMALLPPLRLHLEGRVAGDKPPPFRGLFTQRTVLLSYATTAAAMLAGFAIIPIISPYIQFNLGYPRDGLGLLYLFGGILSLVATQTGGRLVDRFGSFHVGLGGSLLVVAVIWAGFYVEPPLIPVLAIFMLFMLSMGYRNVAYNTLTTKVPSSRERARFMSLQSAVQHLASACGAFLSTRLLTEGPRGRLDGVPRLAAASMALTALVPALMWAVEGRVRRRDLAARNAQPHDPVSGLGGSGPGMPRPLPPADSTAS
jgi:predicted MFS family arabinose efflux permease